MGLDETKQNTGYLLGRLFAVLDKSLYVDDNEVDYNPQLKWGRFDSPMFKPFETFTALIRKYKSDSNTNKKYADLFTDLIHKIKKCPVNCLSSQEQKEFMLGYYQQRSVL